MATTLQEIITRRVEIDAERADAKQSYETLIRRTDAERVTLAKTEACIMAGLDAALIARGRSVIYVQGRAGRVVHGRYSDEDRSGVRDAAVRDAMTWLADGGRLFAGTYIGVKNYDAFGDQRSDCQYGCSPRHGSIVFAIGLADHIRARLRNDDRARMTNEEIDAALYLLTALPRIEDAETSTEAA